MMLLLTGHFHFLVCLGKERTFIRAVRSLTIKTNKNNSKSSATFWAEIFMMPFCNFFVSPPAPLVFFSDMVPIIPQVRLIHSWDSPK